MQLTPPTNYVFFSSIVLALAALALYFLDALGVAEGTLQFAFWVAIVAWLAIAVGVVAKGI